MQLDSLQSGEAASFPLRIIEIDPLTDPRWESFVTNIPTSLIYHHPAWLQVLEEAYGYKPVHLACEDPSGQLRGILPLFYRYGLRTGCNLASLFHSPVAGPLAYDKQASIVLVQAAIARTTAKSGVQLHLKVMSNTLDGLVDGVVGAPLYETYLLALPEQPDLLRLNSHIRWAVNKATRLGVQVREAQTESELQTWYGLYLQTMRRFVVMPKPYRFFQLAWQRLRPRGLLRLLLAERCEAGRKRLLSGFLFLQWGQTISHAFTGWSQEDQALRPNDYLHWRAIQDACADGFRWYDFGDVPKGNQGLSQFKRKWGAEVKMVYDYSYPVSAERTNSTRGLAIDPARRLVHVTWQHLPIKAIWLLSDWSHAIHYY